MAAVVLSLVSWFLKFNQSPKLNRLIPHSMPAHYSKMFQLVLIVMLLEKNAPSYYAIRGGKIAGYGGMAWLEMAFKIEDAVNTAAVAVAVTGCYCWWRCVVRLGLLVVE